MLDNGDISADVSGQGNSGLVEINATEKVTISEGSDIFSDVNGSGIGNSGGIIINTSTLEMLDNGDISASVFGEGNAGKIEINATEKVTISESGDIVSDVEEGGIGNTGGILINTTVLEVDFSDISASVSGQGNTGKIEINATESTTISDGSELVSFVDEEGVGNTEGITINTNTLDILESSNIIADVVGEGNSGGIEINATDGITIISESSFSADVGSVFSSDIGGIRNGGDILINTKNLNLDNASIDASIQTQGDAGKIEINATESITLSDFSLIFNRIDGSGIGNSGGVFINTSKLEMLDNSSIFVDILGEGNSGGIEINATDSITLFEGNDIFSTIERNAIGNTNGITIQTAKLFVNDQARISTTTFGEGNAGLININASESVVVDNGEITSEVQLEATGNSEGIMIDTSTLSIINGGEISALTGGIGDAGLIQINASNEININGNIDINGDVSGIFNGINPNAIGSSGGIILNTTNLSLTNGGRLISSTLGKGDSGLIQITTSENIIIDNDSGILSEVFPDAEGDSNGIIIDTTNLSLTNLGQISSGTAGKGDSGLLDIKASQDITVDDSFIFSGVFSDAEGSSREIIIDSTNLSLINGGQIIADTLGNGNSGLIQITVTEDIVIDGEDSNGLVSAITTRVIENAEGDSGGILIDTTNLSLTNGGQILADTFGNGNSGLIQITATENFVVNGENSNGLISAITSQVGENVEKNSGGIIINTGTLSLLNGVGISATTLGKGDSGLLEINASESIILNGINSNGNSSRILTESGINSEGNSQGMEINTGTLSVFDGGLISSSTFSQGKAGNIDIIASDEVSLSGTVLTDVDILEREIGGIFAFTLTTGKAGNIVIDTPNLTISEGASIEAFTQGGGNAGNITVNAPESIILNSDTKLIVETSDAGIAGDISINTPLLTIGENAQLSATATETSTSPTAGDINLNVNQLNISGELGIFAETQSIADAGSLTIQPNQTNPNLNIQFTDDGLISARTESIGNGGSINITAPQTINIGGLGSITTETEGSGNAGSIFINTNQLNLTEGIEISASTSNLGNSGNITLDAQTLTLDNATIQALTTGSGTPGSIIITNGDNNANQVNLTNANISTEIKADGISNQPANITINTDNLSLDASTITASTTANRDAGNITIPDADNIDLTNNSQITALTTGSGKAGNLNLNVEQEINIDSGSLLNVETQGIGDAGDIDITAQTISIGENAELSARTRELATGKAGNITLDANQLNISGELGIFAETEGIADAGNLTIQPYQINPNLNIQFTDDGLISARTESIGDGGSINITAPQTINIGGLGSITTETEGSGNAGSIFINTNQLNLTEGIEISASTSNLGNSGNITLDAQTLTLDNATIQALTTGSGTPGSIIITNGDNNANQVNLTNANISTEIKADGISNQPANITINTDNLSLDASTITASTTANRDAGNITIPDADNIDLTNNSQITALTTGSGKAGNLNLNVEQEINIDSGSLLNVETQGIGDAGDIDITAQTISIGENAELSARTRELATGKAGNITLDANQLNISGELGIFAETEGIADAGNLTINPKNDPTLNVDFTNEGQISASTTGSGKGGDITITAPETINISGNGSIKVEATAAGDAGTINLTSQTLNLTEGIEITASTLGSGNAGNINLDANQHTFDNATINSFTDGKGNAGSIQISNQGRNAQNITLNNNTQISTEILKNGDANPNNSSNITLQTDNLSVDNSRITTAIEAEGNQKGQGTAGSILVPNAENINLNQSEITASTSGNGDTGEINLNANQIIELQQSQINSSVEQGATGNSREITLTTPNLTLEGNSQISASTAGNGSAGSITVPNANLIKLDNSTISTEVESTGNASQPSNITLTTQQLELNNNAEITGSTSGEGDTGFININSPENIELNNNSIISNSVEQGAIGNSREITLTTSNLTLEGNSQISASTAGNGSAGSITVPNANLIKLDNSTISTEVESTGNASQPSNITLTTQQLELNNNAEITGSTSGEGEAGTLDINAQKIITLDNNSTLSSAANVGATGDGGDINLNTEKLILNRSSRITASSQGQPQADAGSINIQTQDIDLDNNSQIAATTSAGEGGSISIQTLTFKAYNGSQIRTTTSGNQDAGDINIFAQDSILLSGDNTGFFANTTPNSTGDGGNILVDPISFIIEDGAIIAVDSLGIGDGGNITLFADNLTLDRGTVSAQTTSGTGGNITIVVNDILTLRNNAQISTTAGNQNTEGDGGNILIFADFIFAIPSENSDITANAFTGDGGNITITTRGLFGIEPRAKLSPFSDITASSELGTDGIIEINRLNADPIEALGNLPQAPAEVKVVIGCQAVSGGSIGFFDLGRGGIPITPNDLLRSETLITPWIPLKEEVEFDSLDFSLEEFSNARIFVSGIERICGDVQK